MTDSELLSIQIFRRKVEISGTFEDLCTFSVQNQEFLNKIMKACEGIKNEQPAFFKLFNLMPNLLTLERKQICFRKELENFQSQQ